jgi:FAD/FMN-containing dehydrogenase
MREIGPVSTDNQGRQVLTIQAGATLLEMHKWLAERNLEAHFMPEIGDATVGSLVSSGNKDAGLGPRNLSGSLHKSIVKLTYVNSKG